MIIRITHFGRVAFAMILITLTATENIFAQKTLRVTDRGKSQYVIYYDAGAPESVKEAARTLQDYVSEATGAFLKIETDMRQSQGTFISLGETALKENARLKEADLRYDGFQIITRDRSIYIFGPDSPDGTVNEEGGTSHGTANGVYTFLEDYLGIRWLMPGEHGDYVPSTPTFTVPALNRKEDSPFAYRELPHTGANPVIDAWEKRLKLAKVSAPQYNHAWEKTIPPSLYEKHPTWFASVDGKHLPPVARHKLETTNPDLIQGYADAVMSAFRKNPNLKWHSLSPSDGIAGNLDWSNAPEAVALLETDPSGKLSRTKLILKFYNDVARIVKKEFPNHKLGGYIYSSYMYPPKDGIPPLESNLALMLAPHINYGYQLFRPSTLEDFDKLARVWGEASKKNGFDLYYYDLPTALMQHNGIILPPAPEILNNIFPRLEKYGFKGAYVYGRPVWSVFGASNYTIAKLKWNPRLDANKILAEYYEKAFGKAAAPHIDKLYRTLDKGFREYYNRHPRGNYNLTVDHLKEIYAPAYEKLDQHYKDAWDNKSSDPDQTKRLESFGHVLAMLQWNLRNLRLLSPEYKSALTISDDDVNEIISDKRNAVWDVATDGLNIRESITVTEANTASESTSHATPGVPVVGSVQLLLHVPADKEVSVAIDAFKGLGEFVRYVLTDISGSQISAGAIAEGRHISFAGKAGNSYLLDMRSRRASFAFKISGAIAAYKANRDHSRGFLVNTELLQEPATPLYFYVPEGTPHFGVNLGFSLNAVVDVYSPSGENVGQMSTVHAPSSRFDRQEGSVEPGIWKLVIHKSETGGEKLISLLLDDSLPQWFFPSGSPGLKIVEREIQE